MSSTSSLRPALAVLLLCLAVSCCKKTPPPVLAPGATATEAPSSQPLAAADERPATKEACDACGGKWGRHGLADSEGCVCKTKDGGKPCRDGAECQAQCLAGDNDFVTVDKGPPPRGHYQGKCAEYDTSFGCFRIVPRGASKRPPLSPEDAADQICID